MSGYTEGREVSFNGLQYVASYDDLIDRLGANATAGAEHFIQYGRAENRERDSFDEVQYVANYRDLQAAFGTDYDAATRHYIEHGHAEHRTDQSLSAATDFIV